MVKATLSTHRATGEFWPPRELGSAVCGQVSLNQVSVAGIRVVKVMHGGTQPEQRAR